MCTTAARRRLEDLVHVLGDGLLERGAVRLEEEVLVDIEAGESDADELEEIRDEGETVDGLEHTVSGDETNQRVDTEGDHRGLIVGLLPLLGESLGHLLELLVEILGGGVGADGDIASLGGGGG